jgi:protein MpaA
MCNPSGLVDCTRCSRSGADLNREFWQNSAEPEVRLLEAEIRRQEFEGIISLHTDDTSDGVYGFAHYGAETDDLLHDALETAHHALPRCCLMSIDSAFAKTFTLAAVAAWVSTGLVFTAKWKKRNLSGRR